MLFSLFPFLFLYLQNKGGASAGGMPTTSDFKKFQRSYLIVYVCAVMADW